MSQVLGQHLKKLQVVFKHYATETGDGTAPNIDIKDFTNIINDASLFDRSLTKSDALAIFQNCQEEEEDDEDTELSFR